MRLYQEYTDPGLLEHEVLMESNGDKKIVIKGRFGQAETKNQNNRIYPKSILEREVYKLQKVISENRLFGSLDHPYPPTPGFKLEEAAIMIKSLKMDGIDMLGEAIILKDMPKGAMAYTLAKNGIKFGVSTRGLGSATNKNGISVVNEDYKLLTADLVGDPSCKDAFVDTVLESREWVIQYATDSNGVINESKFEIVEDKRLTHLNQLKNLKKTELSEGIITLFDNFLESL